VNSVLRIETETAMSVFPQEVSFDGQEKEIYYSARDCGGKEGPTIVMWESLSEQEKTSSMQEEAQHTTGRCGATQKKGAEDIGSFSGLKGKEI
jgi:hypothetical protein